MFEWTENRLLAKGLKYWAHSCPSLQIKSRKYSAGKNVWHRLWKSEKSWFASKQNECLWRSGHPKGSLKKVFWEISQNSQENICAGISFFDKVKLYRSATSLKTRLQRSYFLVNFVKFVRTPFLQNTTGWLLLIIAVSIVVKGELVNKTVNYDTKTKRVVIFNG